MGEEFMEKKCLEKQVKRGMTECPMARSSREQCCYGKRATSNSRLTEWQNLQYL